MIVERSRERIDGEIKNASGKMLKKIQEIKSKYQIMKKNHEIMNKRNLSQSSLESKPGSGISQNKKTVRYY